ncbi:FEKKY domain-containing protein [Chryseobacterium camelliae]|uniref:FEKKY domain-containing protein n=1 Tax=Chryseobacterium camelliae TaxID=1265445 RepID=UPI002864083D|nr:hypothetical protein [Chryseobacterium camelliae]MDR6516587.1 hypothetical protein [Chryseobacterium camelliae]
MVSKRLLIINVIILLMLLGMYIYGYYLLNYPLNFDFLYIINESKPLYLLTALVITAAISWLISHFKIKSLNHANRFLLVYSILCSLLFCFLTYISIRVYVKSKNVLTALENHYVHQAKEDIKNDKIVFRFAEGLTLPNELQEKIDRIYERYGIHYENTGCIVDPMEIKAQEKYKETVKVYLEKRNGKGWEEKMDHEITQLKED